MKITKKRIKEQLFIGNISQDFNGKYVLTKKGIRAAKLNIFISKYFLYYFMKITPITLRNSSSYIIEYFLSC